MTRRLWFPYTFAHTTIEAGHQFSGDRVESDQLRRQTVGGAQVPNGIRVSGPPSLGQRARDQQINGRWSDASP